MPEEEKGLDMVLADTSQRGRMTDKVHTMAGRSVKTSESTSIF
jgi:hypothetical protein